jgi:multiple sugar transport system permease protein
MAVITTAAPAAARARPGRPRRPRYGDLRTALIFLIPATIGFVTFYLVPAVRGAWFSLTDYSVLAPPRFVGLDNYERLVQDPLFWNAMGVTAYYVVMNIGLQTVLAIAIAVLMQRLTRSAFVRGVVLLPYFVANVVVALVWFFMLDFQMGIVNVLLERVGLDPQAFFGDPALALPTIALINVWRHMGYTALLIFAGLQMIDQQVYEAAELDGAGPMRVVTGIKLPALRGAIVIATIFSIIGSFQLFNEPNILRTLAPNIITTYFTPNMYAYNLSFAGQQYNYSATVAIVMGVITAVIAYVVQLRGSRKEDR